jgi:hypothetical protein
VRIAAFNDKEQRTTVDWREERKKKFLAASPGPSGGIILS